MEGDILCQRPLAYDFLEATPSKAQFGFKSHNIQVTCFHVCESHIVFGTDKGCAFLHSRRNGHMMQLLSEDRKDFVKTVRLLSGIECQVAMGTSDGRVIVIIFSSTADGVAKQVRKFFLGKLHPSSVSCMEWSSNGMKLFSADALGSIYCTKVDTEANSCHASSIYQETSEVTQLEYRHKILLISTMEHTLLYNTDQNIFTNVGSKPIRKGPYGGCFNINTLVERELKVFATRPNLRFWVADNTGKVLSTVKMKENLQQHKKLISLEETSDEVPQSVDQSKLQLGKVLHVGKHCFVTFTDSTLCVINHSSNAIVGLISNCTEIMDVATTCDEIFILSSNRKLYRLAWTPDQVYMGSKSHNAHSSATETFKKDMKESFADIRSHLSPYVDTLQLKMASSAEQLTNKLQSQAKTLKNKVSFLPVSDLAGKLISSNLESVRRGSNVSEVVELSRCLEDSPPKIKTTDEDVVQLVMRELVDQVCELRDQDEFLRSQGIVTSQTHSVYHVVDTTAEQPRKSFFDEVEYFASKETEDILFSSKIRKKKHRKGSILHPVEISKVECDVVGKSTLTSDLHSVQTLKDNRKESLFFNTEEDHTNDSDEFEVAIFNDETHLEHNSRKPKKCGNEHIKSESAEKLSHNDIDTVEKPSQIDLVCHIERSLDIKAENSNEIFPEELFLEKWQTSAIENDSVCVKDDQNGVTSSHDPTNQYTESPSHSQDIMNHTYDLNDFPDDIELQTTQRKTSEHDEFFQEDHTDDLEQFSPKTKKSFNFDEVTVSKPKEENEFGLKIDSDVLSSIQSLTESSQPEEESECLQSSISFDIYAVKDGDHDFQSEEEESVQDNFPELDDDVKNTVSDEIIGQCDEQSTQSENLLSSDVVRTASASDVWTIHVTPKDSIIKLAASSSGDTICHVAYGNNVFVAMETLNNEYRMTWNKLEKLATQVSISPSGDVVWIVTTHRDVYASKINRKQNSFTDWELVASGSHFVCLTATDGWIASGDKLLHISNVNSTQPCGLNTQEIELDGELKISHISVTNEVIWLLVDGCIYCKSLHMLENNEIWRKVNNPHSLNGEDLKVKMITSDYNTTMWGVDEIGNSWFRSKVTHRNPKGCHWWQVYMNEYLYDDHRRLPFLSIQVLPKMPSSIIAAEKYASDVITNSIDKLSNWIHGSSQVITVCISLRAVWIASSDKKLHVCRGPVTGNRWSVPNIPGIASSTKWNHIVSSSYFSSDSGSWEGLVWVARSNGEIICFPSSTNEQNHTIAIAPPTADETNVVSLSACRNALWMVLDSGEIWVRSGISNEYLEGKSWERVEYNNQLDVKMLHISCGSQYVWAVDTNGEVYMRVGVTVTDDHTTMTPAWLSLGNSPFNASGSKFIQVVCGPSDNNVWAVDNLGKVFIRTQITNECPVGEDWKIVEGTTGGQAEKSLTQNTNA
uniref:tectonin beta-propeller repeat-containing protein 2-like isoform X2 n=1 Tax=Ciona intestinalis TaxID=7719 RepID=UPI000EF54E2D|nr:tectonin beta-propeller repeat-containing protein 2-like isoform X2 [Ciona intestinalis]|eukprot:XP_026689605.1 tectonin beta-propeller repeat-containing protein 2-like isoform X2 [Ciona intestinalis]